jgi:arabinan endo-1,5-alpha-L-arabinosidase
MKRCMVLSAACAVAQAQTPPAPFAEAALHAATQRADDSHALQLTGDLAAHDPTLLRSRRGDWFVFSTGAPELAGGTVQIRRSRNGREWFPAGNVFERIPDWLVQAVPGVQNLWAPHVHYHAGTYYLYYSASTFGSNRSVIALATNTTLDPEDPAYRWVDQGQVYASTPQSDHNAIDPVVAEDEQGTVVLSEHGTMSGPGGQDIYSDRHGDYLVHHGYDAQANGAHQMGIRRIEWKDGWPEVADAD